MVKKSDMVMTLQVLLNLMCAQWSRAKSVPQVSCVLSAGGGNMGETGEYIIYNGWFCPPPPPESADMREGLSYTYIPTSVCLTQVQAVILSIHKLQ